MAKKDRRPQRQKDNVRRVQELRQGNATTPVASKKTYQRPKAGARGRDW